jgi:sugar O-acyltransferase (sialic acid O-acetyltransferase NeuD family)
MSREDYMSQVVICGVGRQGIVVLEILRAQGSFMIEGFIDDNPSRHGVTFGGVPVLGETGWVAANADKGLMAIVAIGSNDARVAVANKLRAYGVGLINAIHPSAVVMTGTAVGSGNLICAGAVLVTGTRLEDNVVVNTGATIDHDSVLRTGAYIAPGVHTAGCVTVGQNAFVGVGAVIGPGVTIGDRSIVGAGSVVLSDLPPNVLAFGSPARVAKRINGPVDWRRILSGSSVE